MGEYNFDLKEIEVSKIEVNSFNPRGENIRVNDDQFEFLVKSIKQYGLIVPLIVQKLTTDSSEEKYRLLDGERRFLALKELGMEKAPANIIKDKINNNVAKNVMFHIHTNRKDWEAIEQCRSLEPIYERLKKKHRGDEKKIAGDLVTLTGTIPRTLIHRLEFLRWPQRIKNEIYRDDRRDLYWTVVEIESGIIAPGLQNFPEYFKSVKGGVNAIRSLLFQKYREGIVKAATEVRKIKYLIRADNRNEKQYIDALKILEKLITIKAYTFEEAMEDFASQHPEAESPHRITPQKLIKLLQKAKKQLNDYDISSLQNETKDVRKQLNKAASDIKDALDELLEECS